MKLNEIYICENYLEILQCYNPSKPPLSAPSLTQGSLFTISAGTLELTDFRFGTLSNTQKFYDLKS